MKSMMSATMRMFDVVGVDDENFVEFFRKCDIWLIQCMARAGLPLLRVGLGLVFFWFGALKLFPGLSPAEGLVANTVFFLDSAWFMPFLGVWEMTIGLGLICNRFLRVTLILMFFQMGGTVLPMLILPEVVWTQFPHGLTLEGQYIVKNIVLIGGGMVLGGTLQAKQRPRVYAEKTRNR
jgi:uncharacterized membrane protein YkgB